MNRYAKRYKDQRKYWEVPKTKALSRESLEYALKISKIDCRDNAVGRTLIVPPSLLDYAKVFVGEKSRYWLRKKQQKGKRKII